MDVRKYRRRYIFYHRADDYARNVMTILILKRPVEILIRSGPWKNRA